VTTLVHLCHVEKQRLAVHSIRTELKDMGHGTWREDCCLTDLPVVLRGLWKGSVLCHNHSGGSAHVEVQCQAP
jgi:hypothetical protein